MAKKATTQIKLQIPAGQANPAPPVGPALGQHGLNIQDFCTQFNEQTSDRRGDILPVVISVYDDRSFDFIIKTPPAAELLKKAAKVAKGSSSPRAEKIGSVTMAQIKEIAEMKLADLNTNDIDQAAKIIAGTARQMGLEIKD
ncbi:MAG: 50S ribosomal protein L11 [Candidatus Kerfeldbacteria bacterium CG15_BIG_FIL_POST_REV_8_21_14_020_45_12]|uniref:Large ribosomal subunit protein uL11 n=1 Tax=Candidatus Kerfeldbacteria bacterium CG15_BIG_FIL_POST_REV_8_21_14_020_45_12 TaxID=2014247 RepID=A0A2M7H4L2_9BACT|nr:MAG: 50S ribosomal protein L11 [Candidatus Kerfeldbacteria bacterium CG15_BIG_FIL_POST_REV_8_21_14_020_45_12]PJA93647.1 MAG: 50S ribosomal protein L11 [Candidatus Kerfeldbacteria bacterium CG_4_9_14_3_um_filter_45_8]